MWSFRKISTKSGLLGFVLLVLLGSAELCAQSPNYFHYPAELIPGMLKHSVGLGLADLHQIQDSIF